MTREEEIKNEAISRFKIKHPFIDIARGSFIEGAKWADENPNLYSNEKYHTVKVSCLDELNRKAVLYDKFLEKACKYLESAVRPYMSSSATGDFVYEFRKIMEE